MFRFVRVAKCTTSKLTLRVGMYPDSFPCFDPFRSLNAQLQKWRDGAARQSGVACRNAFSREKTAFPGVAAFDNAQTNPQHARVSLGAAEKCPGIDSDLLSLTPTACSETVRTHQNPLQ